MSTKCQSPLTLWCQHDLVVGIGQIDLSETMTTTQLSHQILWKWHGMTVRFQLLINSDRVILTDPKFSWLSGKAWLTNRNHWCPIVIELGRLPHPFGNSRIVGLAKVLLDGERNNTCFAEDGFCVWLELDLQLEVLETPKFGLEQFGVFLTELLACILKC